jgi:hypothetical protein
MWVDDAFKPHVRDLCENFPTIGFVHVNKQLSSSIFMAKSPLFVKKIQWNAINKIILIVSWPDSNASRVIKCCAEPSFLLCSDSRLFSWNYFISFRYQHMTRRIWVNKLWLITGHNTIKRISHSVVEESENLAYFCYSMDFSTYSPHSSFKNRFQWVM